MKRSLAIKDDTSGSVLLSDLLLFQRSMNRMLSELQDRVYFINKVNGNSMNGSIRTLRSVLRDTCLKAFSQEQS